MSKRTVGLILFAACPAVAGAQGPRVTQPKDYLMERAAEVALARSAAPRAVSDSATVWVLGDDGYAPAAEGSNGFVCYVARSMSLVPVRADGTPSRDYLNPAIRAPHCMSPEAARSIGAWHALMTRLALRGLTQSAIDSAVRAAVAGGVLAPPRSFAIAYMWSPHQHLGANVGAWKPHMMVYTPYINQGMVGETEPLGDGPQVLDGGTPWAALIVPVRQFASAGS
jgi:hypothetical protein